MLFIDARLPVRFGLLETRMAGEAVLTDADGAVDGPVARIDGGRAGHLVGCRCCGPRSGAAAALAALFRTRAMGGALFGGVLAVVEADAERAVRAALTEDAVVAARFRLAG